MAKRLDELLLAVFEIDNDPAQYDAELEGTPHTMTRKQYARLHRAFVNLLAHTPETRAVVEMRRRIA